MFFVSAFYFFKIRLQFHARIFFTYSFKDHEDLKFIYESANVLLSPSTIVGGYHQ